MRAKTWLGFGVLLLAAYAFGADADDKKAKDEAFDPAKLVGTWTYVSGEKNGEKLDKAHFKKGKAIVTRETITLPGQEGKFVMKYKLDMKKKPVSISMEMTESPFGGGAKAEGIIAVKGDELKICYAPMGEAPKAFAAKEGSNHQLFVLQRVKEEKKK